MNITLDNNLIIFSNEYSRGTGYCWKKAIRKAKSLGLFTISFVAFDGGRVKKISDLAIHVEVDNYGLAEDVHHALMHIFAQFLRLQSISEKEKIGKIKF